MIGHRGQVDKVLTMIAGGEPWRRETKTVLRGVIVDNRDP